MHKRAIILAGGRGTRLRPYTVTIPKPLVPLGDTPILEIVIRQLVAADFRHITLAVNYQAEFIQAFFGDGSRWGAKIDFSLEQQPLGTMGPLRLIGDLPQKFLVMNGDVLTDASFSHFFKTHCAEDCVLSIFAAEREQPVDFGVLSISQQGDLVGFQEKPRLKYLVSMGVYGLSRRVLDIIPPDQPFGFDDLVFALLAKHERVAVKVHRGYWLDIGRPDDYELATRDFDQQKSRFGI